MHDTNKEIKDEQRGFHFQWRENGVPVNDVDGIICMSKVGSFVYKQDSMSW